MNEQEFRLVRTLLADRKAFAAFDFSTLSEAARTMLVRGLHARLRFTDARRVKGN